MKLKHKVISFDLDGTFIDEENDVIGGQKTINQLKTLANMGFKLNINTGRLDHDITFICQKYDLPISERISQNGGVVFQDDSLCASLLNKREALNFYKEIKNLSIRVEMNTISNRYWHTNRDPSFPKEYYDSARIVTDFTDIIINQPIVLFLLVGDENQISKARDLVNNKFPKLKAMQTSKTTLEVLPPNVNKGRALQDMYGEARLFVIGDAENDFSMFEIAERSYFVSEKRTHPKATQVLSINEALEDIKKYIKSN